MSLLDHQVAPRPRRTFRSRRRLDRALRAQDRVSARLAELLTVDQVLGDARRTLGRGWLQHSWFSYAGPSGETVTVTACTPRAARRLAAEDVTGACLVGSVIHASGGLPQAHRQVVQSSVDLAWHALYRRPGEQVRWSSSSLEGASRMIDLIHWNDRPDRTVDEVTGLLDRTRGLLGGEVERARDQQRAAGQRVAAASSGAESVGGGVLR